MKIVVNRCYGGFGLSIEAFAMLPKNFDVYSSYARVSKELVALVEEKGTKFCSGSYAKLRVFEIPDEATDFMLQEYDGFETLLYVIDGMIHKL